MQLFEFKSTVLCSEINLGTIANHFGINKKFKWAEPLSLNEKNLDGILLQPENKYVYLFHFGSIVFVNLSFHEMQDIIKYLKNLDEDIGNITPFTYKEDFKLEVKQNLDSGDNSDMSFEIKYNSVVTGSLNSFFVDIIAIVLAKSVSLENVESGIDKLLDEIEDIMEFLDKGHLSLSDKRLAKTSGKILRFKYNSISNLMLLDKPDVTWKYEEVEEFYLELSSLFELKDRYENIRNKSEILMDITEVFTSLSHAKRGNKLEWMVIILIGIEILIFGIEAFVTMLSKLFH
jgi:uncharacterized Rmd1/YagE family protein